MSRRKEPTQEEIDALAERAQDLAIDVRDLAERISIMQLLRPLDPASKFNQASEACTGAVRALLAIARRVEDGAALEADLRKRITQSR